MKEIISVYIYKMRNAPFIGFITLLLSRLKAIDPVLLGITAELEALQAKTDEMESVFKMIQKNELSDDITAADLRRDNAWSGIRAYVQSFSYHFNAAKVNAAKLIADTMNLYGGNIVSLPLVEEMAIMSNFINDCKNKPNLKAAINLVGLDEWIQELEAANTNFIDLYNARVNEMGDAQPLVALKQKRAEATLLYDNLKLSLTSNAFINKYTEPFTNAIGRWNVLGEEQNRLLAMQKSTGDNADDATNTTVEKVV